MNVITKFGLNFSEWSVVFFYSPTLESGVHTSGDVQLYPGLHGVWQIALGQRELQSNI